MSRLVSSNAAAKNMSNEEEQTQEEIDFSVNAPPICENILSLNNSPAFAESFEFLENPMTPLKALEFDSVRKGKFS